MHHWSVVGGIAQPVHCIYILPQTPPYVSLIIYLCTTYLGPDMCQSGLALWRGSDTDVVTPVSTARPCLQGMSAHSEAVRHCASRENNDREGGISAKK